MLQAAQAAPCNTNDRLVDLATGCIAPAKPTNRSTRPRNITIHAQRSVRGGVEPWSSSGVQGVLCAGLCYRNYY